MIPNGIRAGSELHIWRMIIFEQFGSVLVTDNPDTFTVGKAVVIAIPNIDLIYVSYWSSV